MRKAVSHGPNLEHLQLRTPVSTVKAVLPICFFLAQRSHNNRERVSIGYKKTQQMCFTIEAELRWQISHYQSPFSQAPVCSYLETISSHPSAMWAPGTPVICVNKPIPHSMSWFLFISRQHKHSKQQSKRKQCFEHQEKKQKRTLYGEASRTFNQSKSVYHKEVGA